MLVGHNMKVGRIHLESHEDDGIENTKGKIDDRDIEMP